MTLLLRRAEQALWGAGILLAGLCAGIYLEAHLFQALENRRLEEDLRNPAPQRTVPQRAIPPRAPGSLVGRLEIPRLKLSAIVLEGSDSDILRLGIGRLPQAADPGQPGNVVLSAHRDTFFRPLRGIRLGDRVVLRTPGGSFTYTVEWTSVVDPSNTASLRPTSDPALTLVTCYPFRYVGPAPQRFIVRARQVEPPAATARNNPTRDVEVN